MNVKFQAIAVRFLKGFVAGGIASMVGLLQGGVTVTSLVDLRNLGAALLVAFVTGGLLAVQKWVSWVE